MGNLRNQLLIGIGGAVGATIRWAIGELVDDGGFPWATFLVNLLGCALLGAVTYLAVSKSVTSAVAIGFCGGLTTFSTFAVEVVQLGKADDVLIAGLYIAASVAAGLGVFVAARRVVKRRETDWFGR